MPPPTLVLDASVTLTRAFEDEENGTPVKYEIRPSRQALKERTMDPMILKCKEILEKYYGDRFAGLILYGSQGRGQAQTDSDIDLLVLLQGPFDYFQELWNLAGLLYPLQLESDRLISVKPAAKQDFQDGVSKLYRHARREGIHL